jgi:hypothetical protein
MRKGFRPDLRLAKGTALDVPKKSAGSKTGSKRAAISGYSERRTAIKAPGKATSSHIVPQAEFIWHARGQGFESPKLHVFPAQGHISIIEMIFDLLHAGKRISPRHPGFWHGSPRSSDTCRRSWPQEVTLKCPFPGSKTGSKPEAAKRSARPPRSPCVSPSCPAYCDPRRPDVTIAAYT